MNITILGAAGYIGSVLTGELLADGYKVIALDNLMYGQLSLAAYCGDPDFTFVRGDVRDGMMVAAAIKNADVIIPLAAIVGAPACDQDKVAAQTINSDAIRMLCKTASTEQQIIYPNSNSGYGTTPEGTECDENTPLNPISIYGVTKAEGEGQVMERENSIALRLATVFGVSPRMRTDLFVNDMVQRACTDSVVTLFDANARRNYIHVNDIARAFLHCIDNFDDMRGRVYNCGLSDANLTKRQLCEKIKERVPSFVINEAAVGSDPDKRDYLVSNKRIEATGFKCETSLDVGIDELMKFYRMAGRRQFGNV